ncbi:MAG: imelysin family protein [Salibacteraceae bacterium]
MKILKFIFGCGLWLVLALTSCNSKDNNSSSGEDYDRKIMLSNYAENVIIPNYSNLQQITESLKKAAEIFSLNPTESNLESLRLTLFSAHVAYQSCTSFDFGPAKAVVLRSVLNTYPVNKDQIHSNITSGNYDLYTVANLAAKGFPGVEYLIYGEGLTNSEVIELYTTNSESANRAQYLQDVVGQCQVVVKSVYEEWALNGYDQVFINSDGIAVGSSTSLFLNAMVLDFERFIRDGKIGIPLGVRSLGVPNPDKVEAYFSKKSLEVVEASVEKYKDTFNGVSNTGENGQGFDDYLNHEDASSVANNVNKQLDNILAKLALLNGPLSEDVVNNPSDVQKVYDEMQKAIVLLKVEVPSALSVLITYQDSDGD